MQVKVKTKKANIEMKGNIPQEVISTLQKVYKKDVHILNDDGEELVLATETNWFKDIQEKIEPGTVIQIYRENHKLTQSEVGVKIGKTAQFVSDIEHGRRNISLNVAKALSKLFEISIDRLVK